MSGCLNVNPDQPCQVWFDAKLQAEMSHVRAAYCSVHYVMHYFRPSTLICADARWAAVLLHVHDLVHVVRGSAWVFSWPICVCVFVYVTWPCQSIFQCRPFHTQHQAPDPEIQWPHPQTAASVSTHNTQKQKKKSPESMKYSGWTKQNSDSHVVRTVATVYV